MNYDFFIKYKLVFILFLDHYFTYCFLGILIVNMCLLLLICMFCCSFMSCVYLSVSFVAHLCLLLLICACLLFICAFYCWAACFVAHLCLLLLIYAICFSFVPSDCLMLAHLFLLICVLCLGKQAELEKIEFVLWETSSNILNHEI